jgi:H+/Cl- antiporter ClcA
MAIESGQPSPLDYRSRGARRPIARWIVVTLAGAVIALVGVIVFFFAHAISNQTASRSYNPDRATMHEFLWGAFGIALLLVGGLLAAVGLMSWCRDDAG